MSGTIVVGIDFSPASRRALDGAAVFARKSGARIVLVHAFPASAVKRLAGAAKRQVRGAERSAEVDEAVAMTTGWADRARKAGLQVEVATPQGRPADAILAEATRRKATLIALGTSGKGLLKRAFLGSTAKAVADRSPVPVMLFPQRAAVRRRVGPVVAGLALGKGDAAVAGAAAALAADLGVDLHALHALPMPFSWGSFEGSPAAAYTPEMLERDEAEAAAAISATLEPVRQGTEAQGFVEIGDAATAVLTHARRANASCVLVGRTSRRGFGHVVGALVQRADRPLVIVPA